MSSSVSGARVSTSAQFASICSEMCAESQFVDKKNIVVTSNARLVERGKGQQREREQEISFTFALVLCRRIKAKEREKNTEQNLR